MSKPEALPSNISKALGFRSLFSTGLTTHRRDPRKRLQTVHLAMNPAGLRLYREKNSSANATHIRAPDPRHSSLKSKPELCTLQPPILAPAANPVSPLPIIT